MPCHPPPLSAVLWSLCAAAKAQVAPRDAAGGHEAAVCAPGRPPGGLLLRRRLSALLRSQRQRAARHRVRRQPDAQRGQRIYCSELSLRCQWRHRAQRDAAGRGTPAASHRAARGAGGECGAAGLDGGKPADAASKPRATAQSAQSAATCIRCSGSSAVGRHSAGSLRGRCELAANHRRELCGTGGFHSLLLVQAEWSHLWRVAERLPARQR